MADINSFTTSKRIADLASAMLATDAPLAGLVYRDLAAEFGGGSGSTVAVRVPGVATTATRPVGSHADYETTKLTERTIDVALEVEAYSVVPLTLAEADLDLVDYGRQVLTPQTKTVGAHIEREVAAKLAAVTPEALITYEAADPRAAVIRARAKIRANGADASRELNVVAGSTVYADMLLADVIEDGKVAGLPVLESTAVPADALYVFAPEAFALVVRAPKPQPAAIAGASAQTENGLPVTVFQAFNGANGVTSSIVTAFVGVKPLPLLVPDYVAGAMNEVDGGAIVSVDTAPTV